MNKGDVEMKNRVIKLTTTMTAVLALSANAYAGCNNAEISGDWDVTFSDGNSCTLRLDLQGDVVAEESRCYDPFRGATAPDAGSYAVNSDCSINISLVVEGVPVDLAGQVARAGASGAGRYVVAPYWVKGAFTMIRMR